MKISLFLAEDLTGVLCRVGKVFAAFSGVRKEKIPVDYGEQTSCSSFSSYENFRYFVLVKSTRNNGNFRQKSCHQDVYSTSSASSFRRKCVIMIFSPFRSPVDPISRVDGRQSQTTLSEASNKIPMSQSSRVVSSRFLVCKLQG